MTDNNRRFAQKTPGILLKIVKHDIDFLPSKEQNKEIKYVGLTNDFGLRKGEGVKRTV